MIAALRGKIEVVRELLKRGAKKDLKDKDGDTAYDDARSKNHSAIVALLR